MKVYIAGKITGDPDYKAKFQAASDYFTAGGDVVISPAILPAGMTPADYMRICFAMIDSAHIVAFLPDYEDSRGAMLEWHYCQYTSKQTFYMEHVTTPWRALNEPTP